MLEENKRRGIFVSIESLFVFLNGGLFLQIWGLF